MERGVSEVLGYIYIFGIVMTVLAIVFVQVNSMVEDMKKSVLSQSLEQSFKRVQYILNSVAFGDAPAQVVEIELQGGTLTLQNGPEFILAFVNRSNAISGNCSDYNPALGNFDLLCLNLSTGRLDDPSSCGGLYDRKACVLNESVGELLYRYKTWGLSIEAGSVFSSYVGQEYSKLLYEPRILLNTTAGTSKYLVMTIPIMTGTLSIGGSGRFRFVVEEGNSTFADITVDDLQSTFEDAYLIVKDTKHKDGWCRFFDNYGVNSGGVFNLTLNDDSCYGSSPCSCSRADNPTAKIELGEVSNIIVVFKEVRFEE